jgi:hypothetical protein
MAIVYVRCTICIRLSPHEIHSASPLSRSRCCRPQAITRRIGASVIRHSSENEGAPQYACALRGFFSPVICPTICFAKISSTPRIKNNSVFQKIESVVWFAPSRPGKRGASPSSRTRGGMRWTLSDHRRMILGSGRRRRVVLAPLGWCQARDDAFGNRAGDGD